MRKHWKWLIAVVAAGVLVLAVAGTAMAAGPLGNRNAGANASAGTEWGYCQGLGYGMDDAITKLLGMTAAQIAEQRQAGKSLVQIAATKNVTEEALVNAILADRKAALQERVTAGTLTQAQADLMLANMTQNVKAAVNRTTLGPPEGRGRGMMGGRFQQDGAACPGGCGVGGGMMRFGRASN